MLFFFALNNSFIRKLEHCCQTLSTADEIEVASLEMQRTIHVIISDAERTPKKNGPVKSTYTLLISKLLSTEIIASFRSKPEISNGKNINQSNYKEHLDYMTEKFSTLPVNEETKRIINEIIIPGLTNLINNTQLIVDHVKNNFGVIYYLVPDKLPLHTDHSENRDPQEFEETVHRLIVEIFAAFYHCESAGQLPGFFRRLCDGYCLEGRTRDVILWSSNFSEVKLIHEFMESVIEDYRAYSQVMKNMSEDEVSSENPALSFILKRYKGHRCKPDDTYAPDAIINKAGVALYLDDMLAYSQNQTSLAGCLPR